MSTNKVSPGHVPLFFVAQALSDSIHICIRCKHDVMRSFTSCYYGGLTLDQAQAQYPNLLSGQNFEYSSNCAREYFRAHANEFITCLTDAGLQAQLWFALEGQFGFSELFTRDLGHFLSLHQNRLASLQFGHGCDCAEKAVKSQDEVDQPNALFDRVWNHYVDAGLRTMVISTLCRDFSAEAQAQLALLSPNDAICQIWEHIQTSART